MDSLSYRYSAPEANLRIANDTPVWLKPRRTLWFVLRGDTPINDKAGRLRTFKSAAEASAFMERLARAVTV